MDEIEPDRRTAESNRLVGVMRTLFDQKSQIKNQKCNGLEGTMNEIELKKRTKQFALRVIRLIAALPKTVEGRAIANQLVRSGTSVGANYRAACRGRSKPEFVAKLGTVEEEADESAFWMELIIEGQLMKPKQVELLLQEANELVAIMVASRKSASSAGSA
jgi:four helix bundle protein